MRITIPGRSQLAQTQVSRGIRLPNDTSGLRTLAASTQRAFAEAGNIATTLWDQALAYEADEQYAQAVTKYGSGLNDAVSQATAATPAEHGNVWNGVSADALKTALGGIDNKVAQRAFKRYAATAWTARDAEQRKLQRTRITQGRVFSANNRINELTTNLGDFKTLRNEPHTWTEQSIGLFGRNVEGLPVKLSLFEKAVTEGVFNGKDAATALKAARLQVATNLATGFVMASDDPESTAMHLQQVGLSYSQSEVETKIRLMLTDLGPDARAEVMKELVNRATEIATDNAARITRINKADDLRFTDMYNDAFDLDVEMDDLRKMQSELENWTGFTPAFREALRDHIAVRAAGGPIFGNVDIGNSVVSMQDQLSERTLTAAELARHQGNLTQKTYEGLRQAIRVQNQAGFTRANDLIMREFKYEKNKVLIQANTTDPLVRASQAAAQNAQADMLEWRQTNPKATPAESFAKAQELIKLERLGFAGLILDERNKWLKSPGTVSFVGALTSDDPLAELEAKIAAGELKISDWTVAATLAKLRDYDDQLEVD